MATTNTCPFLIGNIVCQCGTMFTIRNPYYGKNPLCSACRIARDQRIMRQRQITPVVPSLNPQWVMHANTTGFAESDLIETTCNWGAFEYPMSSCERDEGRWEIQRSYPVLDLASLLDRDTLKKSKVYFSQIGMKDEEAWIFIIKRPDGIYEYFDASCDYTGFDCYGGGIIRYARDWKTFWEKCLDTHGRSCIKPSNFNVK